MATRFTRLLVLPLLLSMSRGRIIVKPENIVALKGSVVVLKCSVSNSRNVITWSFADMKGNSVLISMKFRVVTKGGKHTVTERVVSATNRFHDLTIREFDASDSGIYSCIDSTDKEEAAATLTLLEVPTCGNQMTQSDARRGNRFFCNFKMSGLISFKGAWKCDYSSNTTSIFTNSTYSRDMYKDSVLYETSVETKALNTRDTPICNLTIKADEIITTTAHSRYYLSEQIPDFTYVIHQAGVPTFNIMDGHNLIVGGTISCYSVSPLPVNYNISVYYGTGSSMAFSVPTNVTTLDELGDYKVHCIAMNSLNLKIVYKALRAVHVVDYYSEVVCRITEECSFIATSIFGVTNVVYLNEGLFDALCQDNTRMKKCIYENFPCFVTTQQQGVMDAYEFLCTDRGKEMFVTTNTIDSQYTVPKNVIASKYLYVVPQELYFEIHNMEGRPTHDFVDMTENIVKYACQRSQLVAGLFHHEFSSFLKYGEEVALWYRELYSHLYELQLYEPKVLHANLIKDQINIENCDTFDNPSLCESLKNCIRVYDMLMNTFSFGYVLIENRYAFVNYSCDLSDQQMEFCEDSFMSKCSPFIQSLYNPLTKLLNVLCTIYYAEYVTYHSCFRRVFLSTKFRRSFKCSKEYITRLAKITSGDMKKHESLAEACMASVNLLECVRLDVEKRCGPEAGMLQRNLLRPILSVALEGFYCHTAFLDPYIILSGAGFLTGTILYFLCNATTPAIFILSVIFYLKGFSLLTLHVI